MIRSFSALALLLAIAAGVAVGCAGGGSHSAPAGPAVSVVPNPNAPAPAGSGSVTVTFRIAQPGTASAHTRSPLYLPSWTTSVALTGTGGISTSINPTTCPSSGGFYTCTVTVAAPLGSDTFTITASDTNGYVLSATTITQTVTNSANVVLATAGTVPASFKYSQSTPGQDACPIAGNGTQTSTWSFVTYDADYLTTGADSAALTAPGPMATTYAIWNDGSVSSFQLSASGSVSATSGALVNATSGSVQTTYTSGTGMVTFTMVGPDAFSYASGAAVTLNNRGSNFNVTPLSNTTSFHGHYIFVNNVTTSPNETDIWDVCQRSRTGADTVLPAPGSTPNITGPVVLDPSGNQHFFQLYNNGSAGAVGFYDYTYPAYTPGSNTPPLIGTYYTNFTGLPQAAAYGSGGFLFVTTTSPAQLLKINVNEASGLTSGSLTSAALTSPAGVAVGNGHVFVADTSANAVDYFAFSNLATQGLFSGTGMVNAPLYLAASSDNAWIAVTANASSNQIPVIATSGPSVAITLTTSLNAIAISWTPTGTSGSCNSASNAGSGVLAVLEQSGSTYKVEWFGGFASGGTYSAPSQGVPCQTWSGNTLSTNTWIDAGSRIMGAVFLSGTDSGGVNTNLQAAGTECWKAINRANGIAAWNRCVTGNAKTITGSQ